jgi:hypothetical protein
MESAALIQFGILIVGLISVFVGLAFNARRVFFAGQAALASSMTAPFIQEYSLSMTGFGASIPIAGVVLTTLALWAIRSNGHLPGKLVGPYGICLLATNIVCFISASGAAEPMQVVKASVGLSIAVISGWILIGSIANTYSRPREITKCIVDGIGLVSVFTSCLAVVFLGPMCLEPGVGGANNQVLILGLQLPRLGMTGFNATGVSAAASFALTYLILSYPRMNGWILRIAAMLAGMACLAALIWSGSRGAIIALGITLIVVRAMVWGAGVRTVLPRSYDLVCLASLAVLTVQLSTNFFRWDVSGGHEQSVLETFLSSRVPDAALGHLSTPSIFGLGYNSLSTLGLQDNSDIESYFIKAFVELGYLGSLVYCFAFIALSWPVLRCDYLASRRGDRLGFTPSAIVIFIYANSPSSWGFIFPSGNLFLFLGLMSSSLVALAQIRRGAMSKSNPLGGVFVPAGGA